RLAMAAARRLAGRKPLCFYGLYAHLADGSGLAERMIGGEYTDGLVAWARGAWAEPVVVDIGRHRSAPSVRDLLPSLERYAHLTVGDDHRQAGYVEASTGCSHRCRHCPVPVLYDGRVRLVDEDVVLADI